MLWHEVCEDLGYNPDSDFGRGFRAGWLDGIIGQKPSSLILSSTNLEYRQGYRIAQEQF